MLKINKVHHIAVICSNYKRSLDFYTNILGFKVISENYRAGRESYKTDLALNHNYVIELFSFPNPPQRITNPEAAGLRHLALEIDDIEESAKELDKMNIEREDIRVDEYTSKRFFFFKDPDGLPIELYEK